MERLLETVQTKRIHYLDSIRGIAALCTLLGHWTHMYGDDGPGFTKSQLSIIDLFVCGADGVSMFFVLSGLVLALKYFQKQNFDINYAGFMVNRIFRIYPAYLLVFLCYFLFSMRGEMHGNFLYRWIFEENHGFLLEASLIRNKSDYFGPGWTLNVEVMLAVIVPFLILLKAYKPRWFKYLTVISLFWVSFYSSFIFHFMLGIAIAAHFNDIRDYDFRGSKWWPYRWLIGLGTWALYAMRGLFSLFPPGGLYWSFSDLSGISMFHYTGLGAALILLLCINSTRLQTFLELRPLVFLGKISYGIYIVHWFFLFFILKPKAEFIGNLFHIGDNGTYAVIGFFTLLFSVIASTLLYYFVEKPFIRYGRKWASKAAARFA